jgi:hypothetical protein
MENFGAAVAPLLAGFIAVTYNLHTAILIICTSAWIAGTILLGLTAWLVPEDIAVLRGQMRQRADAELAKAG